MAGGFESKAETSSATPVAHASAWQRLLPVAAGTIAGGLLVALGTWLLAPSTQPPLARFVIPTPSDAPLRLSGTHPEVAISPDGSRIVYAVGEGGPNVRRLYVRNLDSLEAVPLRGAEGGSYPVFSPDGESVLFADLETNTLKRVSIAGGPATTITTFDNTLLGMAWLADGTIVFADWTSGGLMRVPASGRGSPERLTTAEAQVGSAAGASHRWPVALPDATGVLVQRVEGLQTRISVVSLETSEVTDLIEGGTQPRFMSSGHILYGNPADGSVLAVGFDQKRLALTSNPVPVLETVQTKLNGAVNFSVANSGSLVYVKGTATGTNTTLVFVDGNGQEQSLGLSPRAYYWPRVSPDGMRVAMAVDGDVWLSDLARPGTLQRLTENANTVFLLWTPDSRRIVYPAPTGEPGFKSMSIDGRGIEPFGAVDLTGTRGTEAWTDGGRTLVFVYASPGSGTGLDIGLAPAEGSPPWKPFRQTQANEDEVSVSPDGSWIAYEADDSGRYEVYIERLPDGGDRRQISTDGGREPLWSPDGQTLFFRRAGDGAIMAVPVADGTPGIAELRLDGDYVFASGRTYDITPDGTRFLLMKEAPAGEGSVQPQIVFVQNFGEELQLVPVP